MPIPGTLLELLNAAPGERTAVILPESNIRVTYAELREQVAGLVGALATLGIRRGQRVATVLPNGLPTIVSFLAAAIAGTAAPLNAGYRQDEFSFYLEDTAARWCSARPKGPRRSGAPPRDASRFTPCKWTIRAWSAWRTRPLLKAFPDLKLPLRSPPMSRWCCTPAAAPGGRSACRLQHRNLSASAQNIVETYALTSDDVSLCVMPLFHVHGLVASTLATLLSGGTVVVPAKFNPLSFWRIVRDYDVTWYSAVPTIHQLLLPRAGETRPAGRGEPALHPFVQRVAASAR